MKITNTPFPILDSPWHQSSLQQWFLQPLFLLKTNERPAPECLDPQGSYPHTPPGAAVLGAVHCLEFSEPSVLSVIERGATYQPVPCAWILTASPHQPPNCNSKRALFPVQGVKCEPTSPAHSTLPYVIVWHFLFLRGNQNLPS